MWNDFKRNWDAYVFAFVLAGLIVFSFHLVEVTHENKPEPTNPAKILTQYSAVLIPEKTPGFCGDEIVEAVRWSVDNQSHRVPWIEEGSETFWSLIPVYENVNNILKIQMATWDEVEGWLREAALMGGCPPITE